MTAACPYCRAPFEPDEEVKVCEACATPHHADCYAENGGCTVFGCANAPVDEPKISISASDVASATRGNPPAAAAPPQQTAPTPPPPRSTSAVPPPPRPFSPAYAQPYASPPQPRPISFGGYNPPEIGPISPYIRRRSRLTFILLGVLLGPFGGHNFYAGYVKRAVIQLLITLLSCFSAAIVSWVWAIFEICLVTRDDDGIGFI
jgi:TM2 domain-containing membrane protein YozV